MHLGKLSSEDALVIVDLQNDFCPGGALAVDEADRTVPVLNQWIEAATAGGATVVASRDWHPADHCSFREQGGPWPIHCVRGTPGAEFHPDLRLPDDSLILSKAEDPDRENYSDFQETALADTLRQRGISLFQMTAAAATSPDRIQQPSESPVFSDSVG
jgi:nicotinamidase/pyrazinamidase